MPSVSVSADNLQKQIADLKLATDEIGRTRQAITSQYQQLGQRWNDSKYRTLGGIVNESNASLRNIEKIFLQSQKALVQLLGAVVQYETTNIYRSGSNDSGLPSQRIEGWQERTVQGEDGSFRFSCGSSFESPGDSFCGFLLGAAPWNGDVLFIKGNHYVDYIAFRQSDAGFESDNLQSRNADYITTVCTSDIEGISISARDSANPTAFWSQHRNGGTLDSFREIAAYIPEVQSRLSEGENPDVWDDDISRCYDLYFRDPVMVSDFGGYYEFNGNGRHRILAARSFGYDIPVRVVNRYSLRP